MNIRRRLEVLEQQLGDGLITLVMPGPAGGIRTIKTKRLTQMLGESLRGEMAEDTRSLIGSVSDDCTAVGHGHMTELIRVLYVAGQSAADDGIAQERS